MVPSSASATPPAPNGLTWTKPQLGLVKFEGSKVNNIVLRGTCGAGVIDDTRETISQRRYKMLYGYGHTRIRTSSDGIEWSEPGKLVWDFRYDTPKQAWWDEELQRYVIHVRGRIEKTSSDPSVLSFPFVDPVASEPEVVNPKLYRWNRTLSRVETDDITKPWPIENCRTVLCGDEQDPPDSDIYHPGGVYKYPYADDAYFMFPWVYEQWNDSPHPNDGVINAQFAASRDGWHWMRYDRKPFIPRGSEGDFDFGCSEPVGPFFRENNDLFQYYTGWKWTHGSKRFEEHDTEAENPENWGWKEIRLNRYRLDGFVSVDAKSTGRLVTPPLKTDGNFLELNIAIREGGSARVGLLQEDGSAISGYTTDECEPIRADSVRCSVRWQLKTDLGTLIQSPIRLKIDLENAKLYAFHFHRFDQKD